MSSYIDEAKSFYQRQHIKDACIHHHIEINLQHHLHVLCDAQHHDNGAVINSHHPAVWMDRPHFQHESCCDVITEPVNCIVDVMTLHQFNDPRQNVSIIKSLLKKDGLFIAAFLGGDSFTELRQTLIQTDTNHYQHPYQRLVPMIHPQSACDLLSQAGYKNPIVDHQHVYLHFDTLIDLFTCLENIGERHYFIPPIPNPAMTRHYLKDAQDYYQQHFSSPAGKLVATLDIIYLTGWNG